MAAIMGEPVKKKAVTGAMMLNSNPLHNPTDKTARMMVRFTIGPVMYTDRFLKYWLAIQMVRSSAVCTNCLVVIFIMRSSYRFACMAFAVIPSIRPSLPESELILSGVVLKMIEMTCRLSLQVISQRL